MAQPPFLVSNVLLLAVPLDGCGVLLTIASPIIRVAGPPLLRAIQADLTVFGVRGNLVAVVVGAAAPLAIRLAADRLPRLILRWREDQPAIPALPFSGHIGRCRTSAGQI